MPSREYAVDGDEGFIGLNSRDNPVNLGKNFVSKAQNIRMDRGVAAVRKGAERLTTGALVGQVVYGSCSYTTAAGVELIILVVSNGLFTFTPDTDTLSAKVNFPAGQTISATDEVELYQATGVGYVYILRGFSKSVLRWDGASTIAVPAPGVHHNYPNSRHAIYYGNRHIVQTDRNTIQVSHYLQDDTWSALDVFTINDGSSDTLVAVTPWTLNEFVIFMRNSIFYAAAGVGANASGDAATEADSYIKSLASDIGCVAKGSIVQAGGGILFLSDNGVYMLNPAGAGNGSANTPEGMRLLTLAEPLSATISDVIARINFAAVSKVVSAYWENRYYLAVPLDGSTVNNTVLVYNFLNKAWESVDTYNAAQAIEKFVVAKRGNRRRLFMVDKNEGIFLLEELEYDEFNASSGGVLGTPVLPFYIPATLTGLTFPPITIAGELITRAYNFQTSREKRFSSLSVDASFTAGSNLQTTFITVNPDFNTVINSYGSAADEDATLRLPVRKSGYYSQVKFNSLNLRPSVRSVTVEAIVPGHMTQTRK
jgi:hypothetical protein